ncbi:hypothetical protein Tco_0217988 [Tanacetum coccineum]
MLTGKWTPMNTSVLKFNQLVQETAVHSGENDDDHMSRVHTLYDATVGGEFKHRSAWLFLKGKHKWTNPDSTLQRRNRLLGTDEEPEHFGDDDLPRPPGLQRLAKSQRTSSNSTASSGSNPAAYQEFMAEQYELDPNAKNDRSREASGRPKAGDPISNGLRRTCVDMSPMSRPKKLSPSRLEQRCQVAGNAAVESPESLTLSLHNSFGPRHPNVTIPLLPDFGGVTGIPIGKNKLESDSPREYDDEFLKAFKKQFHGKKYITISDLSKQIQRTTNTDFMFQMNYLMLFSNCMIHSYNSSRLIYYVIKNIKSTDIINDFDWCKDAVNRENFEMSKGRIGLVEVIEDDDNEDENEKHTQKRKLKEVGQL